MHLSVGNDVSLKSSGVERYDSSLDKNRSLRGTLVAKWTAMRRPGVRFPVGTVYLPSFTSFASDSKWVAVSK